jgi:drug/metabolite transporter (DMT)-like permease
LDRTVPRVKWRGAIAATAALAAVGSSFAVLDVLADYPQASGQALRYAAAALMLAAIARGRAARPTPRELVRLALLAASGLAAFNLLVLAAERSMDPGGVGVVVGAVPILLAIAGPLQAGRPVEARVVSAAIVVAAGAALVQGAGGHTTAPGLAAALGALACEAAFSLIAAPLLPRLGAIGVSTWAATLATPQLLLIAALSESPRVPTAHEALGLAWLAVAVTAGGFVLWYTAVGTLGVARAGLFAGVLPVSALLCSAVLNSSAITPQRLAGVLAVAAGISLGVRRAQPTAQPAGPSSSNARTTSGSNCVPAPARISAAACSQVNESR